MNESDWRKALVRKWARLVSPLYPGFSIGQLQGSLEYLIELFIQGLLADPFSQSIFSVIGSKLVEIGFTHSDTLRISLDLLEAEVLPYLPNIDPLLIYPRLNKALIAITVAYHHSSQLSLLHQQEAIRLVMIHDMQKYEDILDMVSPIGWRERKRVYVLPDRQLEILKLIAQRQSNSQIADQLEITKGTVEQHLAKLYKKLGVTGRNAAVRRAIRLGLLEELQIV